MLEPGSVQKPFGNHPTQKTITQDQPVFLTDGIDTVGNQGGTVANDAISVELAEDTVGTGNNFGERGREASYITIIDFLASTIQASSQTSSTPGQGLTTAVQPGGDELWYILGSGWTGFTSADIATSADAEEILVNVSQPDSTQHEAAITPETDTLFRWLGTSDSARLGLYSGSSSDMDVQPVTSGGEGESVTVAEGESGGQVTNSILDPAQATDAALTDSETGEGEDWRFSNTVAPAADESESATDAVIANELWMQGN